MDGLVKNADQIGLIVADLDAFIKAMKELLGLDGFEVIEYPPEGLEVETIYHGHPAGFKARIAFRDFGKFQLEVVEPLEGPSVFKDFLDQNGPGLHHIRFTESDFDQICEQFESRGVQQIASGKGAHGESKWAYFDTSKVLQGLFIEVRKQKF